ncbi:Glyoxylate reductase [Candidatus Gugararchaeum adminiculabundum]|nr:Glyoxylate reductase [Candidatus Gugararchaeum adminiculabundum]
MARKIVIADNMEDEVVAEIKKLGDVTYKPANLMEAVKDAEIIVVRSATKVTKEVIAGAPKLKAVARAGVGIDNIDSVACKARGIQVINTPGASTNAVAELTIGLIIAASRKIGKAYLQMKNGVWDKKALVGNEIQGKTLGIVGYGRIGKAVAEKARALGMNVIAFDPFARSDQHTKIVDIDTLLHQSDVISIHSILTPETRNLFNKASIEKMKTGAIIVNVARGEIVDEDALYDALKSGKVKAAALDVTANEPYKGKLLELDNVVFSSHIGGNTMEAQLKIGSELVQRLREL